MTIFTESFFFGSRIKFDHHNIDCVVLYDRGARSNVVGKDGKSAIQLAVDSGLNDGELMALLRDNSR